jgi:hypothetical protein
MYHGIHTENEQFYLEAQKALHICPSLQHCHAESFPISSSALPPSAGSSGCKGSSSSSLESSYPGRDNKKSMYVSDMHCKYEKYFKYVQYDQYDQYDLYVSYDKYDQYD